MILFSSDACMPACKYWHECFSATGLAVVAVKSQTSAKWQEYSKVPRAYKNW